MAVSARLATCQRALRFERAIRASRASAFRYIGHLRAYKDNAECDTCFRFGETKKPPSPAGDERCLGPWYHPTSTPGGQARRLTARPVEERCGDSITGVAWPFGHRRRLLSPRAVWDEAQRSFSPGLRYRFTPTAVLCILCSGYSSSSTPWRSWIVSTLSRDASGCQGVALAQTSPGGGRCVCPAYPVIDLFRLAGPVPIRRFHTTNSERPRHMPDQSGDLVRSPVHVPGWTTSDRCERFFPRSE